MGSDVGHESLVADLAALGRSLPRPEPSGRLTDAVLARVGDLPPPEAGRVHRLERRLAELVAGRRRRAVAVAAAVLMALLATPAVRAEVADWLGFAGVSVRLDPTYNPTPDPSGAVSPPAADGRSPLGEARRLVGFEPVVLAELGPPQRVQVSEDRRLLSMSWTVEGVGVVRLDQLDGRLDYGLAKTAPGVEFTEVAGAFALWFDEPHEVVVLDADGARRTETARLAGHTLIWEHGDTALRLEGDLTLARAVAIAESAVPAP